VNATASTGVERPGAGVFPGAAGDVIRGRLALSPDEAAAALGVSRDFFDDHIRSDLRLVRKGRKVLVPVRELEVWLEREAERVL
jgi:excisionase family DNA binding protein